VQGNIELTALTHVVAAQKGGNPLVTLLPVILIGVVFYFLLFRPQRRRQQQQAQMQRAIQPGQRVMTTAGMLATVIAIEDDAVVLEIAPGVEARFVRQAIGQVLDDSDADDEEDLDDVADDDEEERETLGDDVEAKTETQPGAGAGTKSAEQSLTDGENNTGKKPSA
jgi:preprotein translocase subunit YajC